MAEETTETKKENEELVVCFISKQTVPVSETVEVQYGPTKTYRVLSRYIRY
jgi:hypothetical protein